jgi:molybdate transport system ATP-binding protein
VSTGLDAHVIVARPTFTLDVRVAAGPGEVLAVLGPNGAGKSTLLGVLAGLLRPDDGHVRLGDTDITDTPPHQREAEARARELLVAVDAEALAARRPAQMSGGQQQRVALARALAPSPGLLLLDEPLAALDIDAAPAMRSLLRRVVRDRKQTALLVTHTALDALVLADRVVVLGAGTVVEEGSTREVLARPRSPFTARIAGLDLVPGTLVNGNLRTADGLTVAGRATDVENGEPAVAVFAPSAVAVYADRPSGSPRNVLPVRLAAVEPFGDVVRLRAAPRPKGPLWTDGLAADVTPAAVADLAVEPGADLWFVVKATEVAIHAASA